MKKFTIFALTIILIISLFVNVSAQETNVYTYNYRNVTVIFDSDCSLSAEQQQHIADTLINGEDNTSTYNLMCTLFGHNYDETIGATTITHKASETAPRCYKEYFLVHVCSRCEESGQVERISGEYIYCCPAS